MMAECMGLRVFQKFTSVFKQIKLLWGLEE